MRDEKFGKVHTKSSAACHGSGARQVADLLASSFRRASGARRRPSATKANVTAVPRTAPISPGAKAPPRDSPKGITFEFALDPLSAPGDLNPTCSGGPQPLQSSLPFFRENTSQIPMTRLAKSPPYIPPWQHWQQVLSSVASGVASAQ
uniref:Uncharacterized protein n=1 Tax=Globodera pallida TaxID=36090 RepID=A0A183C065_GLOPA